jgi:hypothetical protein
MPAVSELRAAVAWDGSDVGWPEYLNLAFAADWAGPSVVDAGHAVTGTEAVACTFLAAIAHPFSQSRGSEQRCLQLLIRSQLQHPTIPHSHPAPTLPSVPQEAGIPAKLAPTIGIAVDHRRTNRSLESLQARWTLLLGL